MVNIVQQKNLFAIGKEVLLYLPQTVRRGRVFAPKVHQWVPDKREFNVQTSSIFSRISTYHSSCFYLSEGSG